MARRSTRLEVELTASDKASKVVRGVADDVDALDRADADVEITADDNASSVIGDVLAKLDGLSDEDKLIALKANATQLESEVRKAERSLGRLDKYDGDTINLKLEARDNASKKLDAIQSEIRSLDGETVRIDVEASGVDDLKSKFADLGGGSGAGGIVALGKGGLIGGAAAGAAALALSVADAAIDAQALATVTGDTVENASKLATLFGDSGFEINDVYDIMLQLNGALRSSPELAEELGINMSDGASIVERFLEVTENLNTEIDDVGRRGEIASALFGEEGVRQVGRIQAEVGDLRTAFDGVSAGRIVTDEDVARAREFKESWRETKGYISEASTAFAQAFLGPTNDLLSGRNLNPFDVPSQTGQNLGVDLWRRIFDGGSSAGPALPSIGDSAVNRSINNLRPGGGITAEQLERSRQSITIINPPGTPAATADQTRLYYGRNGAR